MTAPQHQMFSVRLCSIHWLCRWMPHLDYGNATLTGLPASQLHRLQSVLNAVARLIHRSSQYGMSTSHRCCTNFTGCGLRNASISKAGCARLPIPAWSGARVSFRLHPARHQFQPPLSSVVVILAASDPTYMAVHCRRSCISHGWKPPLEQSAT